jgi:hypothetical protein
VISGDTSVAMLRAYLAGDSFPPDGVEGTPENRQRWDDIARACDEMPKGVSPDVPFDWSGMTGDGHPKG